MKKILSVIIILLFYFSAFCQRDSLYLCFNKLGNASFKVYYNDKLIGTIKSSKNKKKHLHFRKKYSVNYLAIKEDSLSRQWDTLPITIMRKSYFSMKYSDLGLKIINDTKYSTIEIAEFIILGKDGYTIVDRKKILANWVK